MKKLCTLSFFLVCYCMVFANEIRVISVDEFNETIIPAIQKAEKLIQNFEMEFEISGYQKALNSTSADWKDSSYANVKLLSDGKRKGKVKIDVFTEHVGRGISEKTYSLSYNGKQGKKLFHGKSSKGKTLEVKEYTLLSSRSDTISSEMSAALYEKPFILNFLVKGRSDKSFSEYLKMFMKPDIKPSPDFSRSINLVKLENTECVRVQIDAKGPLVDMRIRYWLDPARNYAPLAFETIERDKNGKEGYMSSKKVLKFKKISDGIWFPVKTQSETRSRRGETRKILTVSKVRVNIKNLKDVDFDLNIPDDYKMSSKKTKK